MGDVTNRKLMRDPHGITDMQPPIEIDTNGLTHEGLDFRVGTDRRWPLPVDPYLAADGGRMAKMFLQQVLGLGVTPVSKSPKQRGGQLHPIDLRRVDGLRCEAGGLRSNLLRQSAVGEDVDPDARNKTHEPVPLHRRLGQDSRELAVAKNQIVRPFEARPHVHNLLTRIAGGQPQRGRVAMRRGHRAIRTNEDRHHQRRMRRTLPLTIASPSTSRLIVSYQCLFWGHRIGGEAQQIGVGRTGFLDPADLGKARPHQQS